MTEPTMPPPATPAPAPAAPSPEAKPARGRGLVIWGAVLLALSVLIGIGGIATGIAVGVGGVNKVDDFTRVRVPGEERVLLNEGTIQVWAEADTEIDLLNASVNVTITDPALETEIPVTPSGVSETYNKNGKHGRLIGKAKIPASREYVITTEGDQGTRAAFGNLNLAGTVFGTIGAIFAGIGIGTVLGILGLVLLIVGLVKRSKAKKGATA